MDFGLNEQQEMMRELAGDFLATEYPEKMVKEAAAGETEFSTALWQKMALTNLLGLSLPEEHGGVGDFLDLAVVLEEMGKACFTGPFFSTVVLGASAIMEAGTNEQKEKLLGGMASGELKVTLAVAEEAGRYSADSIKMKAESQPDEFIISGTKTFVPDAAEADYIICAARTDDTKGPEEGITLFMVDINTDGIKIEPLKTISGDRQYRVKFDGVKVSGEDVLGEVGGGWPHLEKVLGKACIARCAEMVGVAQKALDLTLDYAKERIAFGHPIGAFQAVQHRAADMLIDVEGARFVTRQAAWRINEGLAAEREVAIAKAWTGRACRRVMYSAHQIHGAIGFSQDHILHFYTRKARAADFGFGEVDYHLGRLAEINGY